MFSFIKNIIPLILLPFSALYGMGVGLRNFLFDKGILKSRSVSLPVIFAMWVLIEGVIIAVNSFDYKKVGFPGWWCILLLGIAGTLLGALGLRNPDVTAATLSTLIGLGVITMGSAYLFALLGINKFERRVEGFRKEIGIDEQ